MRKRVTKLALSDLYGSLGLRNLAIGAFACFFVRMLPFVFVI